MKTEQVDFAAVQRRVEDLIAARAIGNPLDEMDAARASAADVPPLLAEVARLGDALTNARAATSDRLADRDKICRDVMRERDEARQAHVRAGFDLITVRAECDRYRKALCEVDVAVGNVLALDPTGTAALRGILFAALSGTEEPEPDWLEALANVRFKFWTCPVEGHSDRRGPNGELVGTVRWEGDVAHCTTPGCGRTSESKGAIA